MTVAIWIVAYLIIGIAVAGVLVKVPVDFFRDIESDDLPFVVLLWPLIAFVVLFFTAIGIAGRIIERIWR